MPHGMNIIVKMPGQNIFTISLKKKKRKKKFELLISSYRQSAAQVPIYFSFLFFFLTCIS